MPGKRGSWTGAWFSLARTTARAAEKLGRSAGRSVQARQAVEKVFSSVASPANPPATYGSGRWAEGHWGLGPLAMRRYRLFIPPGTGVRRPAPLLMLLHGCGQDSASFAAATRAASAARAGGYAVLLPEQSPEANPQRCWNWFRGEAVVAAETAILMAILDHVCNVYPLRRERVYALGLSAGGAMALSLALRYPAAFAAVGTHSGAAPGSARTPLQAGQAMRGLRPPETRSLRYCLAGRPLPPLIAIHGSRDWTVAADNADSAVGLWLDLAGRPARQETSREIRRGTRYPFSVCDWRLDERLYIRRIEIAGLGHAWSGGSARQAFADPQGPDALRLAWGFFRNCLSRD